MEADCASGHGRGNKPAMAKKKVYDETIYVRVSADTKARVTQLEGPTKKQADIVRNMLQAALLEIEAGNWIIGEDGVLTKKAD
jgi:hypothetical protein